MNDMKSDDKVEGSPPQSPKTPENQSTQPVNVPRAPKRSVRRRLDVSQEEASDVSERARFLKARRIKMKGLKTKTTRRCSSHALRLYSRVVADGFHEGNLVLAQHCKRVMATSLRQMLTHALAHNPPRIPVSELTFCPGGQALGAGTLNEAFYFLMILSNRTRQHGRAPCGTQNDDNHHRFDCS